MADLINFPNAPDPYDFAEVAKYYFGTTKLSPSLFVPFVVNQVAICPVAKPDDFITGCMDYGKHLSDAHADYRYGLARKSDMPDWQLRKFGSSLAQSSKAVAGAVLEDYVEIAPLMVSNSTNKFQLNSVSGLT